MAKSLDSLSPKTGDKNEVSSPITMPEAAPKKTVDSTTEVAQKPVEAVPLAKLPVLEDITPISSEPVLPANPDSFESLFPEPSVTIAGPPSWLWWIVLIIASIALGFVGYKLVNNKVNSFISLSPTPSIVQKTNTPTPSAQGIPLLTPTATPVATPSPSPSPTATSTPSVTPSTPTVDKTSITMRVLNGTTVSGAATTVKGLLEKAGFVVRTTGNAKSQTYQSTVIYYQTGKLNEAQQIQSTLSSYNPTLQESTGLASPDMILIVYGG